MNDQISQSSRSTKMPKPRFNIHVSIPKEHKLHKGMDMGKMKMGKTQKMEMTGKITSMGTDEFGKNFSMDVENMSIIGDEPRGTIMEDLKKIRNEHMHNEE